MTVDIRTIRKLLVIKLRAVGDVLLSTIVLENLRLAMPHAEIHFLTETASADIVNGNRAVDHVLVYDRETMTGYQLIRSVRSQSYDLILDLFGNPRTALLTWLSGARYRVGYRFRGRAYAYNVLARPRGGEVHNTQFNLDALNAAGIPVVARTVQFSIPPADEAVVDNFLNAAFPHGALLIALNMGGGWYTKRWGLDHFAELADTLIERYGASIVLPWGPGQMPDIEVVRSHMKHQPFIPPATTLPQLAALLKKCSVVISNDSGPMHLAAAVGTPVLGIFGPTSPTLQGPYGPGHVTVRKEGLVCLGCNLTSCPIGHPCMVELPVASVLEAVHNLLLKNNIPIPQPPT